MSQTQKAPLSELLASARVVSIGLTTEFRSVTKREALLFEGPHGWAEFSPFLEYDDHESARWLAAALEFAYQPAPELHRTEIGINATLPAVAADQVAQVLLPFGNFNSIKIKVGGDSSPAEDMARVVAAHAYAPHAQIRLDANGSFDVIAAKQFAEALFARGIQLEYFEQPTATIGTMSQLRDELAAIGVRIAADELIRKSDNPHAVSEVEAADIAVLKVQPLGGISAALELARSTGLAPVVSSALETSVGISMGLHLAGALPQLDFDCGLGTAALLRDDVTDSPLIAVDGKLIVQRVAVSETKLQQLAAPDDRKQWWLDRLSRCYELLG